jgi:hypothetical protein
VIEKRKGSDVFDGSRRSRTVHDRVQRSWWDLWNRSAASHDRNYKHHLFPKYKSDEVGKIVEEIFDRMIVLSKVKNRPTVSKPPGLIMSWIADFFCSSKTRLNIAEPIIADMRFEYYEALQANRRAKAVWVRIRGCLSFLYALGAHRLVKAIGGLFFHPRQPRP